MHKHIRIGKHKGGRPGSRANEIESHVIVVELQARLASIGPIYGSELIVILRVCPNLDGKRKEGKKKEKKREERTKVT